MRCFICLRESSISKEQHRKRKNSSSNNRCRSDDHAQKPADKFVKDEPSVANQSALEVAPTELDAGKSSCDREANKSEARTFEYATLVAATQNFKAENYLGEGGFGKVYKGHLPGTGEIVAVKQLDRNGCQGIREFVVEVLTLSIANHPNLVKLIGYCAEEEQRLLVYEFMALGSLEDHLHDPRPNRKRLDWNTRMKIASGAAQGLEYLHDKMKKPVIYRDLKCSNILLGEGHHPKLSDFGLAKVGPSGDQTHVSTRVMGTYGYCAPDYAMTGQLTFKSDIYSFGVVLLEIITGRRPIDSRRSGTEANLVAWARPLFKDRKNFYQMADPALEGQYPGRGLYQALAIAAMCVHENPNMRPCIADIVTALNYLASQTYDPSIQTPGSRRYKRDGEKKETNEQKFIALLPRKENARKYPSSAVQEVFRRGQDGHFPVSGKTGSSHPCYCAALCLHPLVVFLSGEFGDEEWTNCRCSQSDDAEYNISNINLSTFSIINYRIRATSRIVWNEERLKIFIDKRIRSDIAM